MTTDSRGRDARRVGDIPWSGWRDTLLRVRKRFVEDRLSIVAAGVAFYAVLATFPGLMALLALFGLALDAGRIPGLLSSLQGRLSTEAITMLTDLLRSLADTQNQQGLRVGVIGSLLLTLWGASLGIRALMQALNIAYAEEERRRFVPRVGLALLLTCGAIGVAIILLVAVVGASVTAILDLDPLVQADGVRTLAPRLRDFLGLAARDVPLRAESQAGAVVVGELGCLHCDRALVDGFLGALLVR
jgi:membrane protein